MQGVVSGWLRPARARSPPDQGVKMPLSGAYADVVETVGLEATTPCLQQHGLSSRPSGQLVTETFTRAGMHVRMGRQLFGAFLATGLPAPVARSYGHPRSWARMPAGRSDDQERCVDRLNRPVADGGDRGSAGGQAGGGPPGAVAPRASRNSLLQPSCSMSPDEAP
jgi:hypothetical protein